MTKILTMLMVGLLMFNVQFACAKHKDTLAQPSNTTSAFDVDEDYNFEDFSYNVSDEQLEEVEDMDKIEDKDSDFDDKVINSGHFSSNTATRTWIPINKIK